VSRYQKGKTNLDFTKARDSEWQWHQLEHMQVCTSLQTDNHASTPPLSFYRPDALPAAQPTASKHWRHESIKVNQKYFKKPGYASGCCSLYKFLVSDNLKDKKNTKSRWHLLQKSFPWLIIRWRLLTEGHIADNHKSFSHSPYALQWVGDIPQNCPFPRGFEPAPNIWLLGPHESTRPNGTSVVQVYSRDDG